MTTPELVAVAKKNPIVVGCGMLSLVLLVALYFRSGAIDEANAELDQKSAERSRYQQNLTYAAQLKEQLEALTAANKTIEARLVRPTDIGINQQFFYKLESESGVKLTELHQGGRGTATPKSGFVPVGFTVSLQGDFNQVMAFLRGLEDGTHYVRVLTATCTGGRKGPIVLALTLEILSRP